MIHGRLWTLDSVRELAYFEAPEKARRLGGEASKAALEFRHAKGCRINQRGVGIEFHEGAVKPPFISRRGGALRLFKKAERALKKRCGRPSYGQCAPLVARAHNTSAWRLDGCEAQTRHGAQGQGVNDGSTFLPV